VGAVDCEEEPKSTARSGCATGEMEKIGPGEKNQDPHATVEVGATDCEEGPKSTSRNGCATGEMEKSGPGKKNQDPHATTADGAPECETSPAVGGESGLRMKIQLRDERRVGTSYGAGVGDIDGGADTRMSLRGVRIDGSAR